MAYVPLQFPMVRYDVTGLPVTVPNAAAAAQLPSTFSAVPTTPVAIQAFPPGLIAHIVQLPLTVSLSLPPVLSQAIASNKPKGNR